MAEAVRWGKRGARINTISPGIIVTPRQMMMVPVETSQAITRAVMQVVNTDDLSPNMAPVDKVLAVGIYHMLARTQASLRGNPAVQ